MMENNYNNLKNIIKSNNELLSNELPSDIKTVSGRIYYNHIKNFSCEASLYNNLNFVKVTQPESINPESINKVSLVCFLVSERYKVSTKYLLAPSRLSAKVALCRQIAMYISHVVCELSLTKVAKEFKRDRTTVAHACHLIEDKRDNVIFDKEITGIEQLFIELILTKNFRDFYYCLNKKTSIMSVNYHPSKDLSYFNQVWNETKIDRQTG